LEGNLNFIPSSDGTYYVGIEDGFSTDLSPLDYILHVTAKETIYVGSIHDTYPYSAVVYIEARFPSGEMYTGSGVVVGRNDVLTASHLIYSVEEGGLAEDITVYPGRNGSDMPFGSYDWDFVSYFEVDLDGDGYLYKSDSEKDLAVIGFDQPIGDETGWFGLDGNGTSGNYNLTGYPGIYADETGVRMTNDYGFASKDEKSVFNYSSMEINPGNSGGPLWYLSDLQDPFVVGIASTKDWAAGLELHYDTVMDWIEGNNYLLDESLSMETLSEAAGVSLARDCTELEIMGLPTELYNLS
jgi:V8-like Glu-specific endopeptidase